MTASELIMTTCWTHFSCNLKTSCSSPFSFFPFYVCTKSSFFKSNLSSSWKAYFRFLLFMSCNWKCARRKCCHLQRHSSRLKLTKLKINGLKKEALATILILRLCNCWDRKRIFFQFIDNFLRYYFFKICWFAVIFSN